MTKERNFIAVWFVIFFAVLLWSGIHPHDRFTRVLEVAPAIIGLAVLAYPNRPAALHPQR